MNRHNPARKALQPAALFLLNGALLIALCGYRGAPPNRAGSDHPSSDAPPRAAAKRGKQQREPSAPSNKAGGWKPVFDGKTLRGWKVTDFTAHGPVTVEHGQLILHQGGMLTGVTWTNDDLPRVNYEVRLEAKKLQGDDFFCGLTFPVKNSFLSFIVGGWGGGVVGISSIDGMDASENDTTHYMGFNDNRWYRIRARVTPSRVQTWIDGKRIVNQTITDHTIGLRPGEIEFSKPFGVASYQTTAAIRNFQIRRLPRPVQR